MTHDVSAAVLRVPQVAARLDTSSGTVYRLIREGHLRAVRLGRVIRVPESAVAEFVNAEGGRE